MRAQQIKELLVSLDSLHTSMQIHPCKLGAVVRIVGLRAVEALLAVLKLMVDSGVELGKEASEDADQHEGEWP